MRWGARTSASQSRCTEVYARAGTAGPATTIDVSTRVDTAHDTPRPEIVVQLTKDISAQFAYVLGTPPVGQNPDQTLLTINWRFLGKWSLETTVCPSYFMNGSSTGAEPVAMTMFVADRSATVGVFAF